MRLTTQTFVEYRSSGVQDLGFDQIPSAQLVVGGLCTSCQGCSSCSCTAAVNQVTAVDHTLQHEEER